ncbi:hypothetical protein [Polaribacter sp. SA4-12]|uniref:hypothetical protein n=1 Tax=Polaribacter sp. SA4-12 TaxID=1312072 RepID=UPI000B3CAEC4|nr:hypothetical protein [Polaribacter sp. SA4-12]ARV16682.1 hypothetical protein BTO07_16730 [Polaribacter sp. SA4-12]
MIKKIAFSLLLVLAMSAYSQNKEINNYKYIIVQEKFDFLNNPDQYQTSSLTKFLFQKKGFTVFLSNETLPNDLLQNRCLALTANVTEASSLFSVKTIIELEDCYGKLIYSSKEGKSKKKDYKKGYQESIRNAYKTMSDLEYTYIPEKEVAQVNEVVKSEVALPINKNTIVKVVPEVKEAAPVKNLVSTVIAKPSIVIETLYAQVKTNGFQLVNTTPAIIFQILKTNVKDVFIIKGKNGIIYKSENIWVAEYYENNKLVVKQFDIKF